MPTATSLAAAIEAARPDADVEKIAGGKGDFIVKVDGRELWNKRSHPEGRFPEHDEILSQLGANA
ncbi:MAG: Rdx family protein [Planctomycetes bacterium]|nr:Rdx family protein [Planctomycetota bacterium]